MPVTGLDMGDEAPDWLSQLYGGKGGGDLPSWARFSGGDLPPGFVRFADGSIGPPNPASPFDGGAASRMAQPAGRPWVPPSAAQTRNALVPQGEMLGAPMSPGEIAASLPGALARMTPAGRAIAIGRQLLSSTPAETGELPPQFWPNGGGAGTPRIPGGGAAASPTAWPPGGASPQFRAPWPGRAGLVGAPPVASPSAGGAAAGPASGMSGYPDAVPGAGPAGYDLPPWSPPLPPARPRMAAGGFGASGAHTTPIPPPRPAQARQTASGPGRSRFTTVQYQAPGSGPLSRQPVLTALDLSGLFQR
jgi:hypothetical protein